MQVRQRYTEVFNVLIYVMCMEHRALVQTKRSHDKMAAEWEDLERQLRVAKATATMEHRIREQQAAGAEEKSMRQELAAARLQEELAGVKAENSVSRRSPAPVFCKSANVVKCRTLSKVEQAAQWHMAAVQILRY